MCPIELAGGVGDKNKLGDPKTINQLPGVLYGSPKVHKEGTPMRLIVSAIGSPTYNLAKKLVRILTLLAGNTPH